MVSKMQSQSGFTLVELLMTIVLLSLISTSFSWLLSNALRVASQSKIKTKAINLARIKLEEERSKGYESISNTGLIKSREKDSKYKYQIKVQEVRSGIKKIIVEVYYNQKLVSDLITFINNTSCSGRKN